jgi:hypothetical protein
MKLHLGVIEVPYVAASYTKPPKKATKEALGAARRGRAEKPAGASQARTTGDVAEILEDRYHVMQTFYETVGEAAIVKAIEHSFQVAVENIFMGAPASAQPEAQAMSEIEAAFKHFLSQQEMDGKPGVPTQAALAGVSHRFKRPYDKRPPRPSFIDTGLYQANFHAWAEPT